MSTFSCLVRVRSPESRPSASSSSLREGPASAAGVVPLGALRLESTWPASKVTPSLMPVTSFFQHDSGPEGFAGPESSTSPMVSIHRLAISSELAASTYTRPEEVSTSNTIPCRLLNGLVGTLLQSPGASLCCSCARRISASLISPFGTASERHSTKCKRIRKNYPKWHTHRWNCTPSSDPWNKTKIEMKTK